MINPVPKLESQPKKAVTPQKKEEIMNPTLQGVLVDRHIRNSASGFIDFDETCNALMISPDNPSMQNRHAPQDKQQSFSTKKALLPLLIGTVTVFAGAAALSVLTRKGLQARLKTDITTLDKKLAEPLSEVAMNMNIKEETQFAMYRALRDPNSKNIFGAAAVFLFSGLTIAAKNFVDGAKDIWMKKQEANIERDLQENLIEVETKSFSGKLGVINGLLSENIKNFKKVLNPVQKEVFAPFLAFKGVVKNDTNEHVPLKEKKKNNVFPFILGTLGVLAIGILGAKYALSNIRKTAQDVQEHTKDFTEKVIAKAEELMKNINNKNVDSEDTKKGLVKLFSSIYAKPETIREQLGKHGADDALISEIIAATEKQAKRIYAATPEYMGGIVDKIQYYCFLDEDRGHLYNWVTHPENKFTKYVFLCFSAISSVGYVFKQGLDAIKDVAVRRENSKTELGLKKRLVDVEVENFRSKKNAAITPLLDNFNHQAKKGKSREELKGLAENILFEIKGGPPYVYS